MDSVEIKNIINEAISSNNKQHLIKSLNITNHASLADLLWDYSLNTASELNSLKDKIKESNNKSGQRVKCKQVLPNRRILVKLGPITEELMLSPNVDESKLYPGCEVFIISGCPEGRLVVDTRDDSMTEGRFTKVVRLLSDNRAIIEDGGHSLIMRIIDGVNCKVGDEVRYDLESQMIFEVISSNESSASILEEIPIQTFNDVKGLDEQIKSIKEKIIYPTVYNDKFKKYQLKTIRGALFHGPPGCGKTFLAGAIFNEISKLKNVAPEKGFFVVNGPEFLSKWVGNTEESIRKLFSDARKAAEESGNISLIFWDEVESIASKRKDTATYTPEKTVIPTLLSELQSLKDCGNIVLIAATNRPDLIDPALIRPGRLGDVILEIPRPNSHGAEDIIKAALNRREELPNGIKGLMDGNLITKLINHIYNNEIPIAAIKLSNGNIKKIMRNELASGALFAQIGEEIIRLGCMSEIYGEEPPTVKNLIDMMDKILLNQLGILDANVKNGFSINTNELVIDVSLDI